MDSALTSAVSGLTAMQQALDVVGGNLANVNTPGFKSNVIQFKEALSQVLNPASAATATSGSVDPRQIGEGVGVGSLGSLYSQGALNVTGKTTDMAITGAGFFIVKQADGNQAYTRNGNFALDRNGGLTTSDGLKVQGWMAQNGVINTAAPVQDLSIPLGRLTLARATANASYSGNLDGSASVFKAGPPPTGGQQTTSGTVYDSLGISHSLDVTFTKVTPTVAGASGQWTYAATADGGTAAGSGTLVFKSDGTFDSTNSTVGPLAFTPTTGAAAESIDANFASVTQVATENTSSVIMNSQDGAAPGVLQTFNVNADGTLEGTFSNGLNSKLGRMAVATFANNEGLVRGDNNYLLQSAASGAPDIQVPITNGQGSPGVITGGALENSNVDIGTEFTHMIVAQRAFQANAKMVTVVDQVLNDLANLKQG